MEYTYIISHKSIFKVMSLPKPTENPKKHIVDLSLARNKKTTLEKNHLGSHKRDKSSLDFLLNPKEKTSTQYHSS